MNFHQKPETMYREELQYNYKRMSLLGLLLIFLSGFYFLYPQTPYTDKVLESIFWIMAVGTISLLHFSMLHLHQSLWITVRKLVPIVLDLLLLTHLLILWEAKSVFLLIFYILIVMHAGIGFGKKYFYLGIVMSVFSWGSVLYASPYWQAHSEYLATFALTTFLIPFFYLDYILQMHHDRHTLSRTLENISYEAMIDPLTGAYNRKSYEEICREFIESGEPFSLLYIDLNRFKKINDTRGHHIGDMVLKAVTKKLMSLLGDNDIIARLGGDEFVILVSRRYHNIKELVEKIDYHLIGTYQIEGEAIHVGLSIGISHFPENGHDIISLAACADKAMYHAKNTVGRHYYFYDEIRDGRQASD